MSSRITSVGTAVGYGQSFTIVTPDASSIDSTVLIRPSATTHSKNMSQRYVPLAFTKGANSLEAVAPSSNNIAPPGYYMLFIVDNDGVPSLAEYLRVF